MKKLILLLTVLLLSQCQIKVEPREANASTIQTEQAAYHSMTWTYETNGMTYRIFSYGSGASSASIQVVNVTKDKLEVEKLQLEINNLKK
jgi:hypothetical protein